MSYQTFFYPESKFGEFTDCDGTVVFYNRVNALLKPSFTVLDVGCGRGSFSGDVATFKKNLRILKGKVSKVVGIDVDADARENPYLDNFFRIQGNTWPIEDNSIDLILCDNVMEHIETPDSVFSEMRRVLRNGGYLCMRTPNKTSYISLFSRLIPNRYHRKVLSVAQNGRKEQDVFPTLYKCNTVKDIKKMMKKYGFESVVYTYEAEPSYLSFSKIAYWLGVLHQRFAPKFMKPAIFVFAEIKK